MSLQHNHQHIQFTYLLFKRKNRLNLFSNSCCLHSGNTRGKERVNWAWIANSVRGLYLYILEGSLQNSTKSCSTRKVRSRWKIGRSSFSVSTCRFDKPAIFSALSPEDQNTHPFSSMHAEGYRHSRILSLKVGDETYGSQTLQTDTQFLKEFSVPVREDSCIGSQGVSSVMLLQCTWFAIGFIQRGVWSR